MKQHLSSLRTFLGGEYRRFVLITGAAFAAIVLLSYFGGLLLPEQCNNIVGFFSEAVAESGLVDEAGQFSAVGLFFNNLRAMTLSAAYGFIPFVYFPAFSLGVNSILLGMMAAYYTHNGYSLLLYAAGILPHGIFELPALVLSLACGLYLCHAITRYVRENEKGVMKPLLLDMARLFLLVLVPLLAAAAVVEAYVTPLVMDFLM